MNFSGSCECGRGKGAVLITGASSGIGKACALLLDRLGYRVFAGVRNTRDAEILAKNASMRLLPTMIDVTDPEQIAAAVETVKKTLEVDRGLVGLINNAGIVVGGPLELIPLEEFRRQLEVNVVGHVAVTQAFLPLIRQTRGRIVNVGSAFGRLAVQTAGAYAASKFALEAITDVLRRELGQWGIHVSMVEPGAIQTPILDKTQDAAGRLLDSLPVQAKEMYARMNSRAQKGFMKLRRFATPPEAVAEAVRHALEARRPKTRYWVGRGAKAAYLASIFVPDRLFDWLVEKAFIP